MNFLHLLTITTLLFEIPAVAHSSDECDSKDTLKSHAGHYSRKAFWENLPKLKNWPVTLEKFNSYDSSAINISANGGIASIDGWHEIGAVTCVHFQGKELWAKNPYVSTNAWIGPFIHVGMANTDDISYFDRIFGEGCYTSNKQERWCFQSGTIIIDSERHSAKLVLDTSEMPTYGNSLSIDKKDGFLVFVPSSDGWKIFQDTFVSADGHKDIDPANSLPWRVLKRLHEK
ncbi:MAG: hypothetical protein PHQ60_12960 [Sideroxydans sp.]|nr:hypothetical protein [Sideroxydans sp.]